MPLILDVPLEVLTLILGHVNLRDLLNFSNTCQDLRREFRPEALGPLIKVVEWCQNSKEEGPCLCDRLIPKLLRPMRDRALLYVTSQGNTTWHGYDLLFRRGASFATVPHGCLLEDFFKLGPGPNLSFLLEHGAAFESIPGGVNRLLEETVQKGLIGKRTNILLAHGAVLRDTANAMASFLDQSPSDIESRSIPRTVKFILTHGAPLRDVPASLRDYLIESYHRDRFSDEMELLVQYVPYALQYIIEEAASANHLGPDFNLWLEHGDKARQMKVNGTSLASLIEDGMSLEDIGPEALSRAVATADLDLITVLLEGGISVNSTSPGGATSLHIAAILGNYKVLTYLLLYGADACQTTVCGATPLHIAARFSSSGIVKVLIGRGININAKTLSDGHTPLNLAILYHRTKNAAALLEAGADATMLDRRGWTAMHNAAWEGAVGILKLLVENGQDPDAETMAVEVGGFGPIHRTPLLVACINGQLQIVNLLKDRGVNINKKDTWGFTALHVAAEKGRAGIVASLLDGGANVDAEANDGSTPLHVASHYGWIDIVKTLRRYGADIHKKKKKGFTALHVASRHRRQELVAVLLEDGADVNGEADDRSTAIHVALRNGEYCDNVVKTLQRYGADIHKRNNKGFTAIHLASRLDSEHLITFLLDSGADVNEEADDRSTPLHMACAKSGYGLSRYNVVMLLIDRGANIEAERDDGGTALSLAAASGQTQVIKSLLDRDVQVFGKYRPMFAAVEKDHCRILELLIEKGFSVHTRNSTGESLLHAAASGGFKQTSQILLRAGVEVDAIGGNGTTALQYAITKKSLGCIRLLLDWGADPNTRARTGGFTPLYRAAEEGLLSIVRILVDKNANINLPVCNNDTPLHAASQNGNLGIVRYLVHHHAEINPQKDNGETPLHVAAARGHLEVVKFLIDYGALYTARTACGATAIGVAAEKGHLEVVEFLADLASVAFRATRDDFSRTPLHWAVYRGFLRIAKALICRGFDRTVIDGYGRTALEWVSAPTRAALEWASMNPVSSNRPVIHGCKDTPETDRQTRLRKSVYELCARLLRSNRSREEPGFHELGHCLMLLQQPRDARFSFQQRIIDMYGAVFHEVTCRQCDAGIQGSRFVCSVCPDQDLCTKCHKEAMESSPTCRTHQFLEISSLSCAIAKDDLQSKGISHKVRSWLERLSNDYQD